MNITISDAIVVALISAGVNLTVAFLQNRTKGVEQEKKQSAHDQHIDDVIIRFDERLDKIEERLDTHNHYAEKFGEVDKKVDKLDKKIDLLAKDFEYCKRI